MDFSGINYIAVILAVIASMMTGAAWYGLFSKQWMSAAGLSEADIQQKPSLYVIAILCQAVIAYLLAGLIGHLGTLTIGAGMITAFFCWLGFCLAPMIVNHRFQGNGWNLTIIDGGHWLGVLVIQGAVIGAFGV